MCVGYAARVAAVERERKYAEVECQGIQTMASIALLEDIVPGDYVLVHAGVALEKLSPETAAEIMAILQELGLDDNE